VSFLQQVQSVLKNPHVINIDGGQRIDAQLPNGEAVHVMKYDDSPAWYVAIGEVPAYGSPPLSQSKAVAMILQAAE
jgi:hypothetical protein